MYQVPEEIQSRSGVDTDADRVRGIIIASSFLEVANKPANLRKIGTVASIIGIGQLIFEGTTIENADWENEINWKQYGGELDVCSQTDVEQAEPTENTKATSALMAWQGFVFWCKNTLFPELNTSDKTIIGSVNELKTNVIKLETNETPASIADTDKVRFKSATGYFNRTLLVIKNYVKLGLKASEVANDSTVVLSTTVKGAFDNADCVAVTSLQDTDMIPFGRANGAVSENKMIPAIGAKSYFAPSPVLFNVTTTSELVTILGAPTCPYSVTINLLQEVNFPAILNTYALNILFVGRKIIVSGDVAVNGMRPGAGVISFDVILLITDRAIITVSCFDFMSSLDMRFKDILSNWVDTQYNLKLAYGVDSMVSWGANNLISTKLSNDSEQPVIDNDYYVVTPYGVTFVADGLGLTNALAAEKENMQICATAGITSGSISNIYAGNLWITGRKLIFNSGLITPNSSSGRAVTRVFFDASVTMLGDAVEGACVFVVTSGIWHFTFRNLVQDMPIKFIVSGTSEIHVVCGNTINVDPASTGTYTVTQDNSLDLGQDDVRLDGSNVFNVGAGISANTEVLIKANTGFVTLATLGYISSIVTGSDRKVIITTVTRSETATTFYDIATIPDGWELESVDIIRKDGMHRTAYVSIQCEYGAGNFVIVSGAASIPDAEGYALRIWHSPDKIQHDRYLAKEFTFLYVNNYGANMLVRAIPNSTWLESELEFHIIIKRTL